MNTVSDGSSAGKGRGWRLKLAIPLMLIIVAVLFWAFHGQPIRFVADTPSRFEQHRQAAERGDARAQYEIGLYYFQGVSVARDREMAFACFEDAARRGLPEACLVLGVCLEWGMGVVPDREDALQRYTTAAAFHVEGAGYLLAVLERWEDTPLPGDWIHYGTENTTYWRPPDARTLQRRRTNVFTNARAVQHEKQLQQQAEDWRFVAGNINTVADLLNAAARKMKLDASEPHKMPRW